MLADLLQWLSVNLSETERQQRIFPGGAAEFLKYWKAALIACSCTARALIPAGLRAGGATHHYLLHLDVPRLRRRGRWASEKTLEHYLHEVIHAMCHAELSTQSPQIEFLASHAASFMHPPTTPAPPCSQRIIPLCHGRLRPPTG